MFTLEPRAIRFALESIEQGELFEELCHELLPIIYGREFRPIGGVGDKGVDGIMQMGLNAGPEPDIFQLSIAKDVNRKVKASVTTIANNSIPCRVLRYVSNQDIKDTLSLELWARDEYGIVLQCFDIKWLAANINAHPQASRTFHTFLDKRMHSYISRPEEDFRITNFDGDPRIFVFLSQQRESMHEKEDLKAFILDSLILLALEGTDPDAGVFKSRSEIRSAVAELFQYSQVLLPGLDARLKVLSQKPRKINHHRKEDKYCLPYETRIKLDEKNLLDRALYDDFEKTVTERFEKNIKSSGISLRKPISLIKNAFKKCFEQQGLQFTDFINNSTADSTYGKSLHGVIEPLVSALKRTPEDKEAIERALHTTLREIIYEGTDNEVEYLKRLANTYMMLFLTQGDPEVATYFATVTKKLKLFVDNSVIIPALSEVYLEKRNRRYWSLLLAAKRSGAQLMINAVTIKELASHILRAYNLYNDYYHKRKREFSDDATIRYIDEILIRAFLYQASRGYEGTFTDFLSYFAVPSKDSIEDELIAFLRHEFGIHYIEDAVLDVQVDGSELKKLSDNLQGSKGNISKARNDAKTILSIYKLREKHGERSEMGTLGFHTWWLAEDTKTYEAVQRSFGDKYRPSCYLRPDFLYNFIVLAPSVGQAEDAFNELFLNLSGISISYHLDPKAAESIRQEIKRHDEMPEHRKSVSINRMIDDLKSTKGQNFGLFFDEQLGKG